MLNLIRNYGTKLTSSVYKHISRGPYKVLEEKDLIFFENILGKSRILNNPDDVEPFNTDWMKAFKGKSNVVLKPDNYEEISKILRYCNEQKIAVVPQGGNTGLVGGSVPVFDEVIISTSLMNKVHSIDTHSGIVVCQAGVILENLNEEVGKYGFIFPLDLGAKGSCQIGGNISTNAGGIRLLKYGSLHGSVLGLRVVLPEDGKVLDCLTSLRKDNTGYDLKQLFIGAEGTLGIVTDVSVLCPQKPQSINVAFLACNSFESVMKTFYEAKLGLQEILSAFEMMDQDSIKCVEEKLGYTCPIEGDYEYYLLIETSGSNSEHDYEKLDSFLSKVLEKEHILDGAIAQDQSQARKFWEIRENILEAYDKVSGWYFDDVSTRIGEISEFMKLKKNLPDDWIKDNISMSLFGHMGDGNLHLNLVAPQFNSDLDKKIDEFIYKWLKDHRGSISAEHGLGIKKASYIHYSKSPLVVNYMEAIKNLFDPNNIMNPYKVLVPYRK